MTENEITELREIVRRYSEIDTELDSIKEKMEEFKKRHAELSSELEKLTERENVFISEIKEKYGSVDYNDFLRYINDVSIKTEQ